MNVPFLDLKRQYASIKQDIDDAIREVIESQTFILGKQAESFENNFARFNNAKYCIGTSSGTSALQLSLEALGLSGSEIITVPNTFIATSASITAIGATIKFVDVDPRTYLMDLNALEKAITPKTRAIMPVHLYGKMADMESLEKIARDHGLLLIEDAAQAHGATYLGYKPGHYGKVACFSFFPAKNLGAYGDAGACITNDETIAEKLFMLRDQGRKKGEKYKHEIEAYNQRMDSIQAAVLDVKLKHLGEWVKKRREHARYYAENLPGWVKTPETESIKRDAFHLYVIKTRERDALQAHLKKDGIQTSVHYPIPLHMQPAYSYLNIPEGTFPVTEQNSREILSLPIFAEMTEDELKYVCDSVKRFKP